MKAVRKLGTLFGMLMLVAVLLGALTPVVQAQGSHTKSKSAMSQTHPASKTTTASNKKKTKKKTWRKHASKKKGQSSQTSSSSSTTTNK